MIIIKQLEIKECFAVRHVLLDFHNDNYATIFNSTNTYRVKTALLSAIQQFFCRDTMPAGWKNQQLFKKHGFIKIKFHIAHMKVVQHNDVVEAMRYSGTPDLVYYYFNGEKYIDSINEFQERCQIVDVSCYYPFLNDKAPTYDSKNLLESFVSCTCPISWQTEKSFDMLARFLESPISQELSKRRRIIAEAAEMNLLIDMQRKILKKRTFITIANEIGRIFSYLTFNDYAVNFVIPLSTKKCDLKEMPWEDIELEKVVTQVQRCESDAVECTWTQVEAGLQILLKISRTLALAKHLRQKMVFIDTKLLQEYQNSEMIKAAIIEKSGGVKNANWQKKNLIQRIVDLCNESKIAIFMNYYGVLKLSPKSANIVRCAWETDGHSMYVCTNIEPMDLDHFLKLVLPSNNNGFQ